MSPEEEKVQRLEQRIAQLEQALQEKNAPVSSQPPVPPTMPQQEAPPAIPPMQNVQPISPPPSFQQNVPWTSQTQTMQPVPPPQQMDTEQKFGKIVMGILASIFIFAAILIGYAFLSCRWLGCSPLEQAFPLLGFTGFLRRNIPTFS